MEKNKLKLGYSTSLPIKLENHIYTKKNTENVENVENVENIENNIKLIKILSKKFTCIQIMFSKLKLSSDDIKQIKSILKNYKQIFVHASYQINIGADLIPSQNDLYSTSIEILLNEIIYANKICANGIVVHMGKNVKNKYSNEHIYNNMVKFIIELFKKLKSNKINIPILLETPAGQGGEMCWDLNEFVEFITKFSKLYFYHQLCVCLDTCHLFQAGYDFNNLKIIKQVHKILLPIQNKIQLIHLNDSYYSVGKRKDVHAQIGHGYIQTNKLIQFIYPYKLIPMILETSGPYEEQIKNLTKK